MNSNSRDALIASFDDVRPSFLAAIDQIVAEMRPKMSVPGFYQESVLICARAFADPSLVVEQMMAVEPGILDQVTEDDLVDAHLASVSYLFSLALHELINNQKELPQ